MSRFLPTAFACVAAAAGSLSFGQAATPVSGLSLPQHTAVQSASQPSDSAVMDDQWLKHFDNVRSDVLAQDPRFQALLADSFYTQPETFWHHKSVVQTYLDFLAYPGPVFLEHNRWLMANGTMSKTPDDNGGMLWIDTHTDSQTPTPWLVFSALDVRKHALFLFSSRELAAGEVFPHDLRMNIGRWLGGWSRRAGYVDHVYVVTTAGRQEMRPSDVSVSMAHFTAR